MAQSSVFMIRGVLSDRCHFLQIHFQTKYSLNTLKEETFISCLMVLEVSLVFFWGGGNEEQNALKVGILQKRMVRKRERSQGQRKREGKTE